MNEYIQKLLDKGNEQVFVNEFRKIVISITPDETINLFIKSRIIKLMIDNNLFFSNLDILSKKISSDYIKTCIELIYKYNKDYVLNNKYKLFDYYFSYTFYRQYLDFCETTLSISISDVINYMKVNNTMLKSNEFILFLIGTDKKIFKQNIEFLIEHSYNLIDLKNFIERENLEELNKEQIINRINNIMDNRLDFIIREMISKKLDYQNFEEEKILPTLSRMVCELAEQEGIKYHDITFLHEGDYAACYKIGNKIVHFGEKRKTFHIKNHRRFLQPLNRSEIKTLDDKDFLLCMEITELVDTNNITDEDVYKVYKELRDDGIVWADPKKENLGRLIKDNKIYFEDVNYVDKQATGYLTEADYTLKTGDLVIIDTDFMYEEDDLDYLNHATYKWEEFERRYQDEKFLSIIKSK